MTWHISWPNFWGCRSFARGEMLRWRAQKDLQMKTNCIKRSAAFLHLHKANVRIQHVAHVFPLIPCCVESTVYPKCCLCKRAWATLFCNAILHCTALSGFHFTHKLSSTVQWLNMSLLKSPLLILIRQGSSLSKHCLWTEIVLFFLLLRISFPHLSAEIQLAGTLNFSILV